MPQPLSCQPQPLSPHPEQSSRLTSVPEAVPMRNTGVPLPFTLPENCIHTESLPQKSFCALDLIHNRYGLPASALNVNSK